MKATLESRKSVRLNWFKQERVPFTLKRRVEWSYGQNNVQIAKDTHYVTFQYVFENLVKTIPATNIILFDGDLPQAYLETQGSIGKKFMTNEMEESNLECRDLIVKMDKGEEKVTTKPVPVHEAHRYSEIQIHERMDKIIRKISLKNVTNRAMKNVEVNFVDNQTVRFVRSAPEPKKVDKPEYYWFVDIPPEETVSVEIHLELYTKQTYKIEKTKDKELARTNYNQVQMQE